jgi:hypothetical protein
LHQHPGKRKKMTTPQPIGSRLVDEITAIAFERDLSEFEFKRFEREAKKLAKSDESTSFVVRGMLACLRDDETECRRLHKLSIKLSSGHLFIVNAVNYAVSLGWIGYHEESLQWAKRAFELDPAYHDSLHMILINAINLNDISLVREYAEIHERLFNEPHEEALAYLEDHDDMETLDRADEKIAGQGVVPWEKVKTEFLSD